MTFEYDEKGKIFTDIVTKVAIPATIQTTTHLIRGQLHVRRDQRIKDELDLNENFLALTDANDPQSARSILIERCVLQARFEDSDVTASGLAEKVVDAISVEMAASDPQADIQLALECAGCGHRWKAPFDIVTFFWSEIGAWVKRILREVHILASAYGWPEADILAMSPLRREFYLEMLGA